MRNVFIGLIGVILMTIALSSSSISRVTDALGADEINGGASSPHYQNGRFVSTPPVREISTKDYLGITMKFMFGRKLDSVPQAPLPNIPLNALSFDIPLNRGYRVTWLGHSTTMIEMDGLRILTDPVFGDRASPFTSMGPKRFQKAPLDLADIPEVDVVLISHDHYDHLDIESIKALHPRVKQFITPLGVGAHLVKWGVPVEKIIEKDWWQEAIIEGKVRLIATPARHFSGRGLTDKNKTLWASWAIIGSDHRLFFSGDTGMHPGFKDIGDKFGPFDLVMIENGAYDEDWPDVHMQPEETIQAAQMLQAKLLMPIHWGTFDLANHPWYEPANRIHEQAKQQNLPLAQPRQGEAVGSNEPLPTAQWWAQSSGQLSQSDDVRVAHVTFEIAEPALP